MIEVVRGDITEETTDAIVNAANNVMLGGAGVDGAIHKAGGPAIFDHCRKLGGCETGQAKATTAGKLGAKYVIHTVGPVYGRDPLNQRWLLSQCHRNSLELAGMLDCTSISFPAISTGVYGYPLEEAAMIALQAVDIARHFHHASTIKLVRFVLFNDDAYEIYKTALEDLPKPQQWGPWQASASKGAHFT